jgi:hypothetical protein
MLERLFAYMIVSEIGKKVLASGFVESIGEIQENLDRYVELNPHKKVICFCIDNIGGSFELKAGRKE